MAAPVIPVLTIKPLDPDADGWTEVVLLRDPPVDGPEDMPEGETLGLVRVVEDTVDGPHVWWDVRVPRGTKQHRLRRFVGIDEALVALAQRATAPEFAKRNYDW